jgi:predicted nucleic acid-binding Zn ribbon protein
MDDKVEKYPEGHFVGMWMGICIAIFSGFGIPLSITTGNSGFIGIGPALGVAIGAAIGQSIENKYKQEGRIRLLTESEQKRKRNVVIAGILILTLGVLIFILLYFL